ncbi:MAG: NADP-dependent oxidoreductase [Spirochaetales bacterium]
MHNPLNRQIVLHTRPAGKPTADNFRLVESPVPSLSDGQVLLRTLLLSLDPYMRGRMNEGPSYAPPVAVGQPMVGATVCRVEASKNPAFAVGDLVLGNSGWQDYAVSGGEGLNKLSASLTQPSWALGVLGMPGFTAYMGLLDIGKPIAGETVVVAAASGAVGALVGQIAKLKGCRVVGIAGGEDKCRYVVDELGFDVCLDRRLPGLAARLAEVCPQGIDVYFENVGGEVFDAVWPLLNVHARIPVCGLISGYNAVGLPAGPDRLGSLLGTILVKRLTVKGFIIFDDYGPRFGEFYEQMSAWVAQGKIRFREDFVDGLENAPQAFMGMLEGANFGKLVVRVGS